MSFLGSAKHTLSIGVRVMSDEAVAGFRQAANAAQDSINKQRAGIRAIESDLRALRSKEDEAQRNITARSQQASRDIAAQEAAYTSLTRQIEAQKRALADIEKSAPKGDAAFSQQYRDSIAFNKTVDERIAKLKEEGKVRAANAKLEVDSLKTLATRESKQSEINKNMASVSNDRARLKVLRAQDEADRARGATPYKYKKELETYEARAGALVETRSKLAGVRLKSRELERMAIAGATGAKAFATGVHSEEKNKEIYSEISRRVKTREITKSEATAERKALALEGIFPSAEIAKAFAAKAKLEILPVNQELQKLEKDADRQRNLLNASKERLKAIPNVTGAARERLQERLAITDRIVSAGTNLAELRAVERGNQAATKAMVAQTQSKETVAAANQTKQIADLTASKLVVPERGMSRAAIENKRLADAANAELQSLNARKDANIADTNATKAKRDADIKALRDTKLEAEKASESKRKELDVARAARDANMQQVAASREAARALRQQLIGAITESVAKIAMTLQFIKTVMAATRSAENFEFSSRSVSALLGERRGSGEALYNQYFAKYGQTQSEVMPTAAVERMKQLAAAGYTKSGMVENTAAIFDVMLASAGELTEQSAADLGISLERAFGSLRMDMRTALDTAVKAANQFPMTVGNIRDALGYATEAAVQSGQSLEETLLVIGSIMPIAKTASKAGTITRNALLSLVKPESQQILSELGVRPVDAEGKRRPMMDVFLDLNDQLKEVAKGKASKFYNSPEFIAAEKARAKAEGRAYEPRSLDKVFKNQLGLEREQLEFKLTGVRGGAIFAAINRMVETTTEKLQGTVFEGMRAADARTAFEFLRLGLSGAAGEAARLAGELRRTSKMLGESFDASLERFKIALGTAALPMKDAFLAVGKQILDYFSGKLTPAPGAGKDYIPGAGTGINALGAFGAIAGTGFLAAQVVKFGQALFQARAIIGTLAPIVTTGAATTGVLATLGTAFGSIVAFLTGPFGWAIMGVTAALVSFKVGADAAYKAVTDFSDYLDRQNKSRAQKEDKALGAMFEALASGKLKYDEKTGTVSGLNRGQMLDIAAAGPLAGTLVRGLAEGTLDPSKAGEMLLQGQEARIKAQYALEPDKLAEQLKAFETDKTRILEEVMPNLMRTLLTSENYKGTGKQQGSFTRDQLLAAYSVKLMKDAQFLPLSHQFPTGGAETDLRVNFMKQQNAKTMEEAMSKAGFFDKLDFLYQLGLVPALHRSKITDAKEMDKARVKAAGLENYFVNEDPTREELLNLPFVKNNPERMAKIAEFEQRQAKAAEPISSRSQLNDQGVYEAAITQTSFFTPAVEALIKTVGEGQQSLARVPEFADKISNFLSKAATQEGQAELAAILSQLKLARENAGSPTTTLPNGESGN